MALKHRFRALMLKMMSIYPPYLGAGIRVRRPAPRTFRVQMGLRWYNRNYYGTHFGGSLYSMCDPFFVLILAEAMGREYAVWDKAATIRFLRPGKSTVTALFAIDEATIDELRAAADSSPKVERTFTAEVTGEDGKVVATVEKLIHVRRLRGAES